MYFTEKYKNLMANYFEDIKIKRNIWDEKLDWDSLKESGILAKDKHGCWLGTSHNREIDDKEFDEYRCSECGAEFGCVGDIEWEYCPRCGARMDKELRPEETLERHNGEITIDKTIEIFEGIKKGICPWYPELYYDKAINTMRKYQMIEDIFYHQRGEALENSLRSVIEKGNDD